MRLPHLCRSRRCCSGIVLIIAAFVAGCTEPASRAAHYSDSVLICSNYGFASGTQSFESCTAKLDRLIRDHEANERRCETARQEALRTTPSGNLSTGFGPSVTNANAAYSFCLNERVPPPVQLELPNGQAVTCQQVENHVHCY